MVGRLGRYVVLQRLASGGMADVLLARSEGLAGFARYVVLKRIKPAHARDPRFLRMFLAEARVAAGLHHQHIVQVHDVGEDAGEYFIAMEYLHGEDVRTILAAVARQHRHVPLGHALAIVSATAAGLHHAHERRGPGARPLGIVHRDISPSNLLVGYDGSIKIVDFGIAKATSEQETRSGLLKGKVAYMSPEQCTGGAIDRRSDVYSLGVVLYELCTTTRLFPDDSDYLVMKQIVGGRIAPPRARRPELPGALSAIILRAIAPDRAQRFATADEFRLAIDEFAARSRLAATTSSIAGFMRAQFGERPEPWLETAGRPFAALDQRGTPEARPRVPVAPAPARIPSPASVAPAPRGAARDDRANPGVAIAPAGVRPLAAQAIAMPRCVTPRSESKLAWESQRIAQARRIAVPAVIALIAVPLLAAASVATWRLAAPRDAAAAVTGEPPAAVTGEPPAVAAAGARAARGRADRQPAGSAGQPAGVGRADRQPAGSAVQPASSGAAAASEPTQVARRAEAIAAPGQAIAAPGQAIAAPSQAIAAPGRPTTASPGVPGRAMTADGRAPARDRGTQAGSLRRRIQPAGAAASARPPASRRLGAARGVQATVAPAPPRAPPVRPPAGRALPAVSSVAPLFARWLPAVISPGSSASNSAPAGLHAAAAPAAPSPPATAGPALLSRAEIERVAAPARRALSACAGGEMLQGNVEVQLSVDSRGKVIRAQLSTAVQRPKVAACVLRLVQRWQFPPQRQAGAEGAYTLSFR